MSERLACKAVGLARSTYRRRPVAQTPEAPDAEMRAWCVPTPKKHPCHAFRRACAALRYDERREVNKKKVHRLWREEGLQVRVHSPCKRPDVSSVPPVEADAPNVVWAIDFQFDSTVDGKAIKIASMIDEHTRVSLLDMVERSITGEHLVDELTKVFAANGGPPKVLRMDNGSELVSQAAATVLQRQGRHDLYTAGLPMGQRLHRIVQQPPAQGVPQPATTGTPCSRPAWSSTTSRPTTTRDTATQRWATARRPSTLRRAGARMHQLPAASTENGSTNSTLEPGGLSNGDSPNGLEPE